MPVKDEVNIQLSDAAGKVARNAKLFPAPADFSANAENSSGRCKVNCKLFKRLPLVSSLPYVRSVR
jgi:hypothetical protein